MNHIIHNKIKTFFVGTFKMTFIIGICFIIIYPLIMKLAISLRSLQDIYDSSIIYIPKHYSVYSFVEVIKQMELATVLTNSLLICTISSLLHSFSCTITGYSLAKFDFPFKSIVYLAVIVSFFVPPALLSLPMYVVFKDFNLFGLLGVFTQNKLNLIDNPVSIFLLYGTANALKSGFYIYLMIQFFRNLPKELDEAAYVDGANLYRTFLYINLPSAKTMIATVFLFSFVWQWTDLQYTAMFFQNFTMFSAKMAVLGRTVFQVLSDRGDYSPLILSQQMNAASLIFIAPLILLYVFSNKYFVQSIERSGIVG